MYQSDPSYQRVSLPPQRTKGLIVHGIAALVFGAAGGVLLWFAFQSRNTTALIPYLVFSILFLLPLPWIGYRGLTLWRANYLLDRDGLRLRWGLRSVDIPLVDIEWLRQAQDLVIPLPLPPLAFTGFVRGTRQVEGLGKVEFLASDVKRLLLAATADIVYVISPANIPLFLRHFQDALEMGSLSPVAARSTEPSSYLFRLWRDHIARLLISLGGLLTLALAGITSLLIPTRQAVSIGFDASGAPAEPVPSAYLLLLPIIGLVFYGADVIVGAFFYRRKDQRQVAYVLWASSLVTPLLLTAAIIFTY